MSGWIWLVGLLATVIVVWFVLARRRIAEGTRDGSTARDAGKVPRPSEVRRLVTRRSGERPIADTEFSSEELTAPETPGPWGKVAVPSWEHPLPWSYGQTRLVLLARDPYWLFAYWEITAEALALAEQAAGWGAFHGARAVIRVYDATTGFHYDVSVDEVARNWYLNVGQPDRTWYVELGRVTAAGRFVMLARSNTVHTPRDGPSGVIDWRWPPLGRPAVRLEGMPASPGMGMPASPGMGLPASPGMGLLASPGMVSPLSPGTPDSAWAAGRGPEGGYTRGR